MTAFIEVKDATDGGGNIAIALDEIAMFSTWMIHTEGSPRAKARIYFKHGIRLPGGVADIKCVEVTNTYSEIRDKISAVLKATSGGGIG